MEAVANGAKSKRPSRPSDREAVAHGAKSKWIRKVLPFCHLLALRRFGFLV
jgi:hypothetical protein